MTTQLSKLHLKAKNFLKEFKRENKIVVVVGGCFDVLHIGHIDFLEKSKQAGDVLVVLLESDQSIRKYKGLGRPVYKQQERARMLSSLRFVDLVLSLPGVLVDKDYDQLISAIGPDIIAATKGDKKIEHKKRQARNTGAKLVYVNSRIIKHSTTKTIKSSGQQAEG